MTDLDKPIDIDGRQTTLRKEWGAANASLMKLHTNTIDRGHEDTGHCMLVFRPGQVSASVPISPETYQSVESGTAWQ